MALALGVAALTERVHTRWVGWGGVVVGVGGLIAVPFAHNTVSIGLDDLVGRAWPCCCSARTARRSDGQTRDSASRCGHAQVGRRERPPSWHWPERASRSRSRHRARTGGTRPRSAPSSWRTPPSGCSSSGTGPTNPVGRIALARQRWPGDRARRWSTSGPTRLREDPANRSAALASVARQQPWAASRGWSLVLWLPLVFPDGTTALQRLRRIARRVVAVTLVCFTACLAPLAAPHPHRVRRHRQPDRAAARADAA